MGERNSVYIYKGSSYEDFRDTAVSVVSELGGKLDWDSPSPPTGTRMSTSHQGDVHAAYIFERKREREVATTIGVRLRIPWINLRIEEGSLWAYSLFEGDNHLDNFSTVPEYWGQDPEWNATQRGNPSLLARVWNIDQASIENYLRPWGFTENVEAGTFETTLRGKAYPHDKCEYGDIWQMNDFLRALGAHDPNTDQPHSVARKLSF